MNMSVTYRLLKRVLDIGVVVPIAVALGPLVLLAGMAIKLSSKGPVLHVSDRVGKDNRIFKMYKFRTMRNDTPAVATHLLTDANNYLTPIGRLLRKTSLDEIPQILNVIKGDMSLVGPRPALFNQDDLVALRTDKGVHRLIPGITGWAQTHGRDEIPIPLKVERDAFYLENQSLLLDLKILVLTAGQVLLGKDVSH